jgi:hypothetical protein
MKKGKISSIPGDIKGLMDKCDIFINVINGANVVVCDGCRTGTDSPYSGECYFGRDESEKAYTGEV